MKKILALVMAMIMAVSCMSVMTFAADPIDTLGLYCRNSGTPGAAVAITASGDYTFTVDDATHINNDLILIKGASDTTTTTLPEGTRIQTSKVTVNLKEGDPLVFVGGENLRNSAADYTVGADHKLEIVYYLTYTGTNRMEGYTAPAASAIDSIVVDVTVTLPTAVEGISLNTNTLALETAGTAQLEATLTPADATIQTVTWASDDDTVATVVNGLVTAVNPGTANITVTAKDGGFTDTCVVTVTAAAGDVAVDSVTIDQDKVVLNVGEEATLVATVAPEDATNKTVFWSSSDEAIAIVDDAGKVTAVGEGIATITATTESGSKTDTCEISVVLPRTGTLIDMDFEDLAVGDWTTHAGSGNLSAEEGYLTTTDRWNGAFRTCVPIGTLAKGAKYTITFDVYAPSSDADIDGAVTVSAFVVNGTGVEGTDMITKHTSVPVDTWVEDVTIVVEPDNNVPSAWLSFSTIQHNPWSCAPSFSIDNVKVSYEAAPKEIALELPEVVVGETVMSDLTMGDADIAWTKDGAPVETGAVAEDGIYSGTVVVTLDGTYAPEDLVVTIGRDEAEFTVQTNDDNTTTVTITFTLNTAGDANRRVGWFVTSDKTHAFIIGRAIITMNHEFDANGKCVLCRYETDVVVSDDDTIEVPAEIKEYAKIGLSVGDMSIINSVAITGEGDYTVTAKPNGSEKWVQIASDTGDLWNKNTDLPAGTVIETTKVIIDGVEYTGDQIANAARYFTVAEGGAVEVNYFADHFALGQHNNLEGYEFYVANEITVEFTVKFADGDVEVANSYESETEETEDVEVTDTEENPDTGLALAMVPAAIALAVVAFKKR